MPYQLVLFGKFFLLINVLLNPMVLYLLIPLAQLHQKFQAAQCADLHPVFLLCDAQGSHHILYRPDADAPACVPAHFQSGADPVGDNLHRHGERTRHAGLPHRDRRIPDHSRCQRNWAARLFPDFTARESSSGRGGTESVLTFSDKNIDKTAETEYHR